MRPVLIAVGGDPGVLRRGVVALRALLAHEPPTEARADAHAALDSLDAALRFAAAPPEAPPAATAEQLAAQVRAVDAPDPSPRCASTWCRRHVPREGEYCSVCTPAAYDEGAP